MSVTTETKSRPATKRAHKTAEGPTTAVDAGIAPPPQLRRRPLLVVASGAVGGVRSGHNGSGGGGGPPHHPAGGTDQPRRSGDGTDWSGSCAQSDSGRPA